MNKDLVELLIVTLLYIESKTEESNPFVRKFGGENTEEEAFKMLVEQVKNCEYLFPEIEKMNIEILNEIKAQNNIEATSEQAD